MVTKYKLLLLAFLLQLILCSGCGAADKPENVVKTFSEAMINYDIETMNSCYADAGSNLVANPEESEEDFELIMLDFAKEQAAKTTYEIIDIEIEKEKANVTVKYCFSDLAPISRESSKDVMIQMYASIIAEDDYNFDTMNESYKEFFDNNKEETNISVAEKEITFICVPVGEEWKIKEVSDVDTLENVMVCNIRKGLYAIENPFDKISAKKSELTVELVDNDVKLIKGYGGDVHVNSWMSYKNRTKSLRDSLPRI